MIAVPVETPVTTPDVAFTASMVGSWLVQVPPVERSLKDIDWPTQTLVGPVIAGNVLDTVNRAVAVQPVTGNI
jgi:hypothetical protein